MSFSSLDIKYFSFKPSMLLYNPSKLPTEKYPPNICTTAPKGKVRKRKRKSAKSSSPWANNIFLFYLLITSFTLVVLCWLIVEGRHETNLPSRSFTLSWIVLLFSTTAGEKLEFYWWHSLSLCVLYSSHLPYFSSRNQGMYTLCLKWQTNRSFMTVKVTSSFTNPL